MENTEDEVLKRADVAMYEAKEAGRNSVRFYEDQAQGVSQG
jgi:GGDEF domain-containing protein